MEVLSLRLRYELTLQLWIITYTFYNKLPRNLELRIEHLISKWKHFMILFTLNQNDCKGDSRNRKTPDP